MPEVKKKIPLLGREVEVSDVPIKTLNEPWSQYELEDGTVIRFKSVANSIVRIEGQYDPANGFPIYLVFSSPVISVVSVSPNMTKKV